MVTNNKTTTDWIWLICLALTIILGLILINKVMIIENHTMNSCDKYYTALLKDCQINCAGEIITIGDKDGINYKSNHTERPSFQDRKENQEIYIRP